MSRSKPGIAGDQHPLWLFRDLVGGEEGSPLLEAACDVGRVERWGHAAQVPVWAAGDEVVLVVEGTVVTDADSPKAGARLTRGDAFGKTPMGRVSGGSDEPLVVGSIRETTICTLPLEELRQIWDRESVRRVVRAGRWFNKEEVSVPIWPLLGAMPTTRLARILLHLVENYGEIQAGRGRLPLTLRPSQLAELAGVATKRAGHVWGLFERAGLVNVEKGELILPDLSRLREYTLAG